jgi:protein-disulfide isomerase
VRYFFLARPFTHRTIGALSPPVHLSNPFPRLNLCYSARDFADALSLASEDSLNRRLLLAPAFTVAVTALFAVILLATPPRQTTQTAKKTSTAAKTAAPTKLTETATSPVVLISVNGVNDIDPSKALGSKSAPVTMEIFSDFQCPACKQLFTTTSQKVINDYVNTGKIYMVHRDFPLPMHAYSRIAASYSRAAAHIGKNDVVEVALFQNQEKWETNGDIQSIVAAVLTPAEMKKVQSLVDAKTLEPLIEKDKQLGLGYSVNQTPTSWLHTKGGQSFPVVGFVQYDVLKTFLDQLVAQK